MKTQTTGWELSCDIHLRASIIGTTAASRRRSAAGPILSRPATLDCCGPLRAKSRVPIATSVSGSCVPCCLSLVHDLPSQTRRSKGIPCEPEYRYLSSWRRTKTDHGGDDHPSQVLAVSGSGQMRISPPSGSRNLGNGTPVVIRLGWLFPCLSTSSRSDRGFCSRAAESKSHRHSWLAAAARRSTQHRRRRARASDSKARTGVWPSCLKRNPSLRSSSSFGDHRETGQEDHSNEQGRR
jgi:hypothetical protein